MAISIEFQSNAQRHSQYDWADISIGNEHIGKARCKQIVPVGTEKSSIIICSINIYPEWEEHGYGREFVDYCKHHFEIVIADRVRQTAIGFWEAMGFFKNKDGNWIYRRKEGEGTMIKKILIVDDTPVSRRILKSCITRNEQYEFFEAGDGFDGFEIFKKERPDLTFMDINMPKIGGIECLEAIRKFDPHAMVVMCSSEINPESLKTVTSLGALSVINKPPTKESVQEAISKADDTKK